MWWLKFYSDPNFLCALDGYPQVFWIAVYDYLIAVVLHVLHSPDGCTIPRPRFEISDHL